MASRRASVSQQGMALIAMLILSGILMLVMSGIFYRHQLDVAQAHRIFTTEQAALLALSGESWAGRLLRDDARNSDIDSLVEDWAQSIPPLPVEGGLLTGCLIDLQARFNINNLGSYDSEEWEAELGNISSSHLDTFLNLLALQGLDSEDSRAAVVVDWIDADSELIAGFSAEDPEYLAMRPPRMAANRPLVSVDELAGLAGYSAAELVTLRPLLSALPMETPININTASSQVLAALIPFIDDWVIEEILLNRPFEDVESFYEFLAETTLYLSVAEVSEQLPDRLIDVESRFFGLHADVELGGVRIRLETEIFRPGAGETRVLSRTFETLPAVQLAEDPVDLLVSPCQQETVAT